MMACPKVSEHTARLRMARITALCPRYYSINIFWVSSVSFAAITLCIAFRWVFNLFMLKAIHNFLMAEQCSCMKVCWQFRNTALEMHEILKTAADDNAMEITQSFEQFSWFKRLENSGDDCEHSGHPSASSTDINMQKISKIINKDACSTILMSLAGYTSYMKHFCNSKARFKHVATLCIVCASVPH